MEEEVSGSEHSCCKSFLVYNTTLMAKASFMGLIGLVAMIKKPMSEEYGLDEGYLGIFSSKWRFYGRGFLFCPKLISCVPHVPFIQKAQTWLFPQLCDRHHRSCFCPSLHLFWRSGINSSAPIHAHLWAFKRIQFHSLLDCYPILRCGWERQDQNVALGSFDQFWGYLCNDHRFIFDAWPFLGLENMRKPWDHSISIFLDPRFLHHRRSQNEKQLIGFE